MGSMPEKTPSKNSKPPKIIANSKDEPMTEKQEGFDPIHLEDQRSALPANIIHLAQKPKTTDVWLFSSIAIVGHMGLTAYGFPWYTGFVLMLLVTIGKESLETNNENELPKRRGILMGPDQISFSDDFGNRDWRSVKHVEGMSLQCFPRLGTIELHYSKPQGNPESISMRNMHMGPTLTALENWIGQKDRRDTDPTDAERHGQWLAVMETLETYRGWLPKELFDDMPRYPYKTEELRTFTEKLKHHEDGIRRKDQFVSIRTVIICLLCLGGMISIGLFGQPKGPWAWAPLSFPAAYWVWVSRSRLMYYRKDRGAKVFYSHFQMGLILLAYTWYMMR